MSLCYLDRTFCNNENCSCERKLTPEIIAAVEKWWGSKDAPIAVTNGCIKCMGNIGGNNEL